MGEENTDQITLVDEAGQEHQFTLVDVVELDERRYALMIPVGDGKASGEEEEEAYIFRLETDEKGEDVLVDIEDEEEFERVCAIFEESDESIADDEEEEDQE